MQVKFHWLYTRLKLKNSKHPGHLNWVELFIAPAKCSPTHKHALKHFMATAGSWSQSLSSHWNGGSCLLVINGSHQLLMSYTTPFHTSCVGVRWKMCMAYRASFRHNLKKWQCAFHPLFATTYPFHICIFEIKFSHFFRGVGLAV